MRATHTTRLAIFLGFLQLGSAQVAPEGVSVTIRCDKDHYKVGETIKFNIVYKNISNAPIWLLAQTESYPVDVLSIKKVGDSRRPEKIRLGEQSVVWDALAQKVVRLKPSAEIPRLLEANVLSKLPSIYDDRSTGMFLVLPASAVRLPGAGKYEIRAMFHSSPNHPVNRYLPRGAQLWRGDVTSEPIAIAISK
jgi:hypothetical protein